MFSLSPYFERSSGFIRIFVSFVWSQLITLFYFFIRWHQHLNSVFMEISLSLLQLIRSHDEIEIESVTINICLNSKPYTNVSLQNRKALYVHWCPSSSTYVRSFYANQFISIKAVFFIDLNILIRKYSNKRLLRVQMEVNDVGVITRQKEQVAARGLRVNWISIEPWRFYLTKNSTEPFLWCFT